MSFVTINRTSKMFQYEFINNFEIHLKNHFTPANKAKLIDSISIMQSPINSCCKLAFLFDDYSLLAALCHHLLMLVAFSDKITYSLVVIS